MKKRLRLISLMAVTILCAICVILYAQGNKELFDGKNEFNPNDSYIIDGAYWEISIGEKHIEWGNEVNIPHDAGYIGLYRQTMSTFLMEYSLHPFSYGQRNLFDIPNPANKYLAIYIRSSTFKIDSFLFLRGDQIIGTLGAYSEAEVDNSTINFDGSLDPAIFNETDHKFAQLGTGSDKKYSCIVVKFSTEAEFNKIQIVVLP